jgi:hypothetical protein
MADWVEQSGGNGNGGYTMYGDTDTGTSVVTYTDTETGRSWNYVFQNEQLVKVYEVGGARPPAVGGVDPNPEDNGQGTQPPNFAQLVAGAHKQAMLDGKPQQVMAPSFWASQIGQHLIGQGAGIIPKHQPGDDDNNRIGAKKGAMVPDKNAKTEKQVKKIGQKLALATPGYQPNSGTYADYIKGLPKSGPKKGGGGGGGQGKSGSGNAHDKDKVKGHGVFSGDMPGPPELVNPSWRRGKSKAAADDRRMPDNRFAAMRNDIRVSMPSLGGQAISIRR